MHTSRKRRIFLTSSLDILYYGIFETAVDTEQKVGILELAQEEQSFVVMHKICASHWYQVSSIHHAFRHETKIEPCSFLEKSVCIVVKTRECFRIFFHSRANPGCWAWTRLKLLHGSNVGALDVVLEALDLLLELVEETLSSSMTRLIWSFLMPKPTATSLEPPQTRPSCSMARTPSSSSFMLVSSSVNFR